MRIATITRYESSSRPWTRLVELAGDRFPDALDDVTFLRAHDVKLQLDIDDAGIGYRMTLLGPEVEVVERNRAEQGRSPLSAVLAALATDTQEFEVTRAKRLAREAARGELTPRDARSMCEGFGYEAFDAEYSRYQEEIRLSMSAKRRQGKRWALGGKPK